MKLGVAFPASTPVDQSDAGRIIGGHYKVVKVIGEGAFGKVRLAVDTNTGEEVAVKTYHLAKLQPVELERIRREVAALRVVSHPNVIKLAEAIEEKGKRIFLVLQLARGGDLLDYVDERGRLDEATTCRFFVQIVEGLACCHAHGIVHRDLKLENVLLDNDDRTCLITDFGLSNSVAGDSAEMLRTICGTPIYRPPEMLRDQPYTAAVDVWALGVMVYSMLHGSFPFYETSLPLLFQRILAGKYPAPRYGSADAQDMIRRLLTPDPRKRITIPEIRLHPFYLTGAALLAADAAPTAPPPEPEKEEEEFVPQRRLSQLFRVSDLSGGKADPQRRDSLGVGTRHSLRQQRRKSTSERPISPEKTEAAPHPAIQEVALE
eukprot:TRINITY_DN2665_c0_g1_i1.p1 TRINITY_DN2665_c0_g1~~TRINITY_DN2665_c0_g1_i1.p1  ORF type:complete len:437 (-),score=79.93 TRINITY_DN2665_c0_g1_i1:5-1132(-)